MGDLVQALPALSDAKAARPEIEFDWVVDESFAEIPAWHPAVADTLITAHRRWRNGGLLAWRNKEFRAFAGQLRSQTYDAVIDAQTNLKSALVTALSKGEKHGPDGASAREWGAHLVYRKRYAIAKDQLAIDRSRQLFAKVLNYPLPTSPPDFGLTDVDWPEVSITLPEQPYLVFVQNASWTSKRWHDDHWQKLIQKAGEQGFRVLLPWGSELERSQAQALIEGQAHAQVLPRMSLSELAGVLRASAGAICVDTGMAHVSAALDVPTVTLYGATDPDLIGATGGRSVHLEVQDYDCAPCYKRACVVGDYRGEEAQCMKTLGVDLVWNSLTALLNWPLKVLPAASEPGA